MLLAAILTVNMPVFVFGQSMGNPRFTALSPQDSTRLEEQRALVAATIWQRYGVHSLTKTKADIPILQKLIDDKVFDKSQTYELQSLGVAFGDVLAHELSLRWVMITDEYGTDPTLRLKNTSTNVNALTMISKRIEKGQAVSLSELLRITRKALAQIGKGTWPPNSNAK